MAASETIHLGPILYCERSTKLLFPGVHGTQAQDQSTLLMPGPASLAHLAAVTSLSGCHCLKNLSTPEFQASWMPNNSHRGTGRSISLQIPNLAYPTPNKLRVHFLCKTRVCALAVPWKDNTRCLLGNGHKIGGPSISGSVLWVPFYGPCFKGPFTVWRPSLGI